MCSVHQKGLILTGESHIGRGNVLSKPKYMPLLLGYCWGHFSISSSFGLGLVYSMLDIGVKLVIHIINNNPTAFCIIQNIII